MDTEKEIRRLKRRVADLEIAVNRLLDDCSPLMHHGGNDMRYSIMSEEGAIEKRARKNIKRRK